MSGYTTSDLEELSEDEHVEDTSTLLGEDVRIINAANTKHIRLLMMNMADLYLRMTGGMNCNL
jgi:hypothetical protein